MVNITSLLAKAGSGLGFSFGVRAWTEIDILCVKSMYRLKQVSSEKSQGLNSSIPRERERERYLLSIDNIVQGHCSQMHILLDHMEA